MIDKMRPAIFFLLGPTAAGKTPLAIELVQRLPLSIISVDSAMVYRGLAIGTGKPSPAELTRAPHRLIDIRDPTAIYSAGQFRTDALQAITEIHQMGQVPLLVGGTMMYFNILQHGLADLPIANTTIRTAISQKAQQSGWEALHRHLMQIDPITASRIHARDQQRIQRALEVYEITGQPLSALQIKTANALANYTVHVFAIEPKKRSQLHQRIEKRFQSMLQKGLISEVEPLFNRGDLHLGLPAMRSVGYQQIWHYLAGHIDQQTMHNQAIAATRQLAKRQLTWLRRWPNLTWFDSDDDHLLEKVCDWIGRRL